MATDSPNVTRLSFSSAGAVRARPRHVAVLPAVQLAHAGLIAALAQQTPHHIVGHYADRFDVMEARDHLQAINAAVLTYNRAIVDNIKEMAPTGYIKTGNVGCLEDAASEIYTALDNAVERMIEDQAQAAE